MLGKNLKPISTINNKYGHLFKYDLSYLYFHSMIAEHYLIIYEGK